MRGGRRGGGRRARRAAPSRAPARPGETPPALRARIAGEPYGRRPGTELLELRPGHWRAALRLAPDMVNVRGGPHGGAIFSLADFAVAGGCNGHGGPARARGSPHGR